MKKLIIFILVFVIIGFITGYFLFGKIGNHYISIESLLDLSGGGLEKFGKKLTGVQGIRKDILISGLAGAILGVIIGYFRKK